jgi:hypothetical protein
LAALGIDPRRYWLLTDLFGDLSERRELLNQLGRDGITLKISSWLFAAVGGLCCLGFLHPAPTATRFLGSFVVITGLMLGCILISEAGNSLVNPVEGLVLAHQPIDGATYTAAKLTHLLRIVAMLAPALNAVPAGASLLLLERPFWYYPLIHLAATFAAALLVALAACALFGWLLRFVPAARLKSVGQMVEALPFLSMMFAGQIWALLSRYLVLLLPQGSVPRTGVAIAFPVAAVAVTAMGVRSLSGDYMIRVSSIVHGGGGGRVKPRRSRLGALVGRLLGGPPARAGYAFTARLMRRDWAFRRQLILLVPSVISPIVMLAKGIRADPFAGTLTIVHVIPHIFGIALFLIAASIVYGGDYKGAWVFLLAPSGAFVGFARGVYGLLWTSVIGIPHAILLIVLVWYWPLIHAVLFTAFSISVASLYLGMVLRLIDGVPFSKQPVTSRGTYLFGIMLAGGVAIGIAVAIQYLVVFRSVLVVAVVTALVAMTALLVTRASLEAFTVAMRFNLGLVSEEVGPLYTEVDA